MAFRYSTALTAIKENAKAHHGDDAAKGRALAVIAKWAKEALYVPETSHLRFIGGTIYCPVEKCRVQLGPEHPYGAAFVCPGCGTKVEGRDA